MSVALLLPLAQACGGPLEHGAGRATDDDAPGARSAGASGTAAAGEARSTVLLTASEPVSVLPVPARSAERLRVRVSEVVNPDALSIGLRVTVLDPAGRRLATLGRFAVFPPTRTGDYVLPVTADVRALLESPDNRLEFALAPSPEAGAAVSMRFGLVWE